MFRLSAILTILCLGCLLPLAASPLRICLLDMEERTVDCCKDCDSEEEGCCMDIQPVPPAPVAKGYFDWPDLSEGVVPTGAPIVPEREMTGVLPRWSRPPPLAAPPSARRVLLNVWRL